MTMSLLRQTYVKGKQLLSVCVCKQYIYILIICTVSLILSSKGITDEGIILPGDDMSRYMMNGAYFYDLIRDLPLSNIIQYTSQYFARYPALSLGHHPLLPGMALVPFYAVFGVSVFSARLMVIAFILLGGIVWFKFIRDIYDENIALISTLLLVSNQAIVRLSRVVMSEIPALVLMIVAAYFFYQYCRLEQKKYGWAFLFSLILSIYAKHTAIVLVPFCLGYFVLTKGMRRVFRKDIVIFSIIMTLLILPLVPITLKFSQYNIDLTKHVMSVTSQSIPWRRFERLLQYLWSSHLSHPVLVISLISICISLYRRKKREVTFVLWIIFFYFFCVYFGAPTARHSIYWIPAFCVLASVLLNFLRYRLWKVFMSTVFILIAGYQFTIAFQSSAEYAYGYEEAAEYISKNWKGDSVLYSSKYDTGYFIFFVRKYNQDQNRIVLRASKVLATFGMGRIVEDRLQSRREIYDTLDEFGIAYVVIEDLRSKSQALQWLREEVKSDRFILRNRIRIRSNSSPVNGCALDIYEYKGYTRAKSDAILRMNIPLMGDSVSVRFGDLLRKNSQ